MSELKYRPEIDGLRAIAVAAVVLYHADPALLPGGFIGVDVFFVISGYLITALLAAEWGRTGRLDFAAFYARRVRRLLPALLVLVVCVMVAATVLMGRHGEVFEQTGASAVASLLFVANVYFQLNSGGYFNAPVEGMPLLHLWSLSVEEQFYLVYPLVLALLLRWVPGGVPRRIAALSVMSLLLAEYWVHILPERAFYQMPSRFWELAAGALVALSSASLPARAWHRGCVPVGLLLVAGSCLWVSRLDPFPGLTAVPAVAGAALVLLGVHRQSVQGLSAALLRSRPFVALGLVSYSLYLWHWPLLAIDTNLRFEAAPRSLRLLLCAVALALAWLSWRFVERPFRRGGAGSWRVLANGAVATALAVALVATLARIDLVPAEARQRADQARADRPAGMVACHFASNDAVQALPPASCRSRPGQAPSVVFWGDSHARAWEPFAWRLAEAADASAYGVTMNACLPGDGLDPADSSATADNCRRFNQLAVQQAAADGVDTVILSLRWPMSARAGDPPPRGYAGRLARLDVALGRIAHVRQVLVIGPIPLLRHGGPACIATGREDECAVTRAHFDEQTRIVWRELRQLAARHPNVRLVDAADYFCDAGRCPVSRDGHGLYFDDNHITRTAAERFAERYLADPVRYTVDPDETLRDAPPESR